METVRLTNSDSVWYNVFLSIYEKSFPIHEQRTAIQQEKAFASPAYHLDVYTEGDQLLAFIAYWEMEEYIYIEHLAVNPDCRGQNIGTALLASFTADRNKTVLLEIDPLTDEVARRRLRFYEHVGFHMNELPHFHPPYREGNPPHALIILSHGGPAPVPLLKKFQQELKETIMDFTQ